MLSLEEECELLFDYLTGIDPSEYIVEAYLRAHQEVGLIPDAASGPDAVLMSFASFGGWRLAVADAYSRLFVPTSLLRKKLVLALALAENSSEGYDQFNLESDKGVFRSIFEITYLGFRFLALLLIGILILYPRMPSQSRL